MKKDGGGAVRALAGGSRKALRGFLLECEGDGAKRQVGGNHGFNKIGGQVVGEIRDDGAGRDVVGFTEFIQWLSEDVGVNDSNVGAIGGGGAEKREQASICFDGEDVGGSSGDEAGEMAEASADFEYRVA